jgi:hypothetical protein
MHNSLDIKRMVIPVVFQAAALLPALVHPVTYKSKLLRMNKLVAWQQLEIHRVKDKTI